MLGQKRISEITDALLARSRADQTEVVILANDEALTRFANSTIHQNVAETDTEVRIRVVVDKRIGVATTNNLSDDSLTRTLETALTVARLQPPNPEFKSLPEPQPLPEVAAFSQATADCSPERRARDVGAICSLAREAGVGAFGALTTTALEIAVANSLGVFAYFPTTYADLVTVAMGDSGSGYASAMALSVEDLDAEAIGREAVEKCLRSQEPRPLPPGEYTVILEPYAVQDMVQMMAYSGFGALAVQEGRSFMAGKMGQRIMDARISMWDDGLDPAGLPLPFDFEGVPKQRVDLIERGVARGVVYDSATAAKEEGKVSTGHALPAPNTQGPIPQNLFLAPGDTTLAEMVRSTERGVYVTRFHYTRPVEPMRLVVTGMTRDGTFLIENGEIAYPVKNLRFTQSYVEALNQVGGLGRQAQLLSGFWGRSPTSVPALKLDSFRFTGATEF